MRTKQYIKEINKYRENLSKENQDKFDEILLKIRFSNICNHDAEEFSHHCLDLFLQAEKEQIPIEDVLNTHDINTFCNDFIEETKRGYSPLQKLYWRIGNLPFILFLFTGIWEMLIGYLIKAWVQKQTLFMVPVTLSMVVDFILVMILVDFLLNQSYFFHRIFNGTDKRKDRIATVCLWLGFCMLTALFVLSKLYLNYVLFHVNYFIFMAALGLLCLLQLFFENRKVS